jgi:hypothetical protein
LESKAIKIKEGDKTTKKSNGLQNLSTRGTFICSNSKNLYTKCERKIL